MLASPPARILQEYGEATWELTAEQERTLRRVSSGRLATAPTDVAGVWNVKASSYVGTVVTPDLKVLIKPKVDIANLFHLLDVDSSLLDLASAAFEYQKTNDLAAAFAVFYCHALERALARGVTRQYVSLNERLVGIRGRVDLTAQMRQAGLPLPVHCTFDEYTADTPLNRILRTAALRLLRMAGIGPRTRQSLARLATRLEEAGAATPADLAAPTMFTRLNEHCRPAEHLGRLILEGSSILDASGSSGASVFLIDMIKVFETFVEARLRTYLRGHLNVQGQYSLFLDTGDEIRIRPDLVFDAPHSKTHVYVADTKYKLTWDGFGRESDYYQMLAYCSSLGLREGMLIYCRHDGHPPSQEIKVRHVGTRLRTHAVRLDRSPAHIDAELKALAMAILGRAVGGQSERLQGLMTAFALER